MKEASVDTFFKKLARKQYNVFENFLKDGQIKHISMMKKRILKIKV